ncbi:hypothetical protein F5146DRAFT_605122 [Armillaria mellea]|nr:hypothetical protein F5146DRAFT_605122 [Armillaria mellea]
MPAVQQIFVPAKRAASDLEESVMDGLQLNDTLLSTVDVNGTALTAYFSDNAVARSFSSKPVTPGDEGFGWISIEWVLVRLNTTYSPSGTFAAYNAESVLDANGTKTRIGYDPAVCLELHELYIVETYNSTTGLPSYRRYQSEQGDHRLFCAGCPRRKTDRQGRDWF